MSVKKIIETNPAASHLSTLKKHAVAGWSRVKSLKANWDKENDKILQEKIQTHSKVIAEKMAEEKVLEAVKHVEKKLLKKFTDEMKKSESKILQKMKVVYAREKLAEKAF